eukprot:TRINITY_DN78691_c0_g1_i1.p2 TRINITY_DN78691_c0_g1~~TRINITY_DN78691_c0_g1_i1.p2  ORF type:complete len:148 (-),score=39.29 TRINITY_DN78691_c0_g1_i1:84-527(-)
MDQLTPELTNELKKVFALLVRDDGCVTSKELGTIMRCLGHSPTEAELKDMVNEVDNDGSGAIDFAEFTSLITRRPREVSAKDELEEVWEVFDRDKDQVIGQTDLLHAMESLGEKMTDAELLEMLKEIDADQDGRVTCKDFLDTMLGA